MCDPCAALWRYCIGINLTYSNLTTDQAEHKGPCASCFVWRGGGYFVHLFVIHDNYVLTASVSVIKQNIMGHGPLV